MACQHVSLQFNSGDYCVTCRVCGARWGRIHHKQPEYGQDSKGDPIGCCPEEANQGWCDPDQLRHRRPASFNAVNLWNSGDRGE